MDKKDIFISYSRKDIAMAREIKHKVESMTSVSCWMDMDGIESGSQFQDVIISAINDSKIVLLLLSKNSMESPWVKNEVNFAREKQKKVVPINIDGSQPGDWFLFFFSGNDVIDFRNKDQQNKLLNNISIWCRHDPKGPLQDGDNKHGGDLGITNNIVFHRLTRIGFYLQYFIWGVLGLISLWLTVTGTLKIGNSILPLLLDILIFGTLVSTFYLSNAKKWAFYVVFLLDLLEIFIVCEMGTYVFYVSPHGGYKTAIYTNLWGLGSFIAWKSFFLTYVLLSLSAIIHISVMAILLMLKNNDKKSGWFLLNKKITNKHTYTLL